MVCFANVVCLVKFVFCRGDRPPYISLHIMSIMIIMIMIMTSIIIIILTIIIVSTVPGAAAALYSAPFS